MRALMHYARLDALHAPWYIKKRLLIWIWQN
nr:MAG TPA: hypothetical protein [Caudoviricetes sp.]